MPQKTRPAQTGRRNALKILAAGAPALAVALPAAAQEHHHEEAMNDEQAIHDKLAIREVIENWAIFRDAALWDKFRTTWHSDGYMMATWFQGTSEEFIDISRKGFEAGKSTILHFLGGSNIELAGQRAIVQTKMTITQRAPLDGTPVDVVCTGRFYDFFEKREGKWAIVLRRLFYEQDRMAPVDPGMTVKLDPKILEQFPVGYRNLAYLQESLGFKVKRNMPGLKGPDADRLYALGARWLAGAKMDASFRE